MASDETKRGKLSFVVSTLAIAMAVYHLLTTQILLLSQMQFLNVHLAFGLCIVFLQAAEQRKRGQWLFILAFLAALLVTGYIHHEANILHDREQMPNTLDTVVGVVIIGLVILGTYSAFGPVLPVLALLGIVYAFLGPYAPGPFFHGGIDFVRLVAMLTTDLAGIYGTLLIISATYLAVFLVLGSTIENSGAARFFIDMPLALFRGVKGGGSYAAVVASALMGMASGSPTANVLTTGTFTIPLMKRQGFSPQMAGAVEAAASTGGQIMPPVMGAVAFVMAEFTGISYLTICGYAAIPAFLYFAAVGLSVHFRVRSMDLPSFKVVGLPALRSVLWDVKYFLPIVLLVGVMAAGYTPAMAAFWAVVGLLLVSTPRRPDAAFFRTIGRCFDRGGRSAAEFALAMACISIFVEVVTATGVGLKLPLILIEYSGGSLFRAYLLTAFALAVLGMEIPTVPAYIIVAVVAVPALVKLGATLVQAHFFALYFSVLAALTPPVALAALAAARLARADYFKTAWWAMKFGYLAFVIPFLFAYNPAILALRSVSEILSATAVTLLGCVFIAACIQGHFLIRTSNFERALLGLAGAGLFAFVVDSEVLYLAGGLACGAAAVFKQLNWTGANVLRLLERPKPLSAEQIDSERK